MEDTFQGDDKIRCLACDENLSDREANRKYVNWRDISNSEQRYIGLCDCCIRDTDLLYPDGDVVTSETLGDLAGEDWVGEGE